MLVQLPSVVVYVVLLSTEESEEEEYNELAEPGRVIAIPAWSMEASMSSSTSDSSKDACAFANGVRGGFTKQHGLGVRGRGDSIGGGVEWRIPVPGKLVERNDGRRDGAAALGVTSPELDETGLDIVVEMVGLK